MKFIFSLLKFIIIFIIYLSLLGQISRRITVDKIRGEDTLVWALEALK